MTYLDTRIKALLEPLLAKPEEERPIIVLMADEGPYPKRYEGNPLIQGPDPDFDWSTVTDDELRIKFGILHAMLLPDIDDAEVPRELTSVNTFRFLFNKYFGADLPLRRTGSLSRCPEPTSTWPAGSAWSRDPLAAAQQEQDPQALLIGASGRPRIVPGRRPEPVEVYSGKTSRRDASRRRTIASSFGTNSTIAHGARSANSPSTIGSGTLREIARWWTAPAPARCPRRPARAASGARDPPSRSPGSGSRRRG